LDSFRKIGEETLGYKIIGTLNGISKIELKFSRYKVFIAIGNNFLRRTVLETILNIMPEIKFVNAIHPSA
jgi:hypothetical protein